MVNSKRVLAVITARGGSKGLPGKNKRLLLGKPLLAWPINAAKGCPSVDRVILSTECDEIAKLGTEFGADVPWLRPENLASDSAKSVDVILDVIARCESEGDFYDYVLMLEPTSPLTDAEDISTALSSLHANRSIADSIVGVAPIEATHPEYSVKKDCNNLISPAFSQDFKTLRRRQDIEELFFLEGSLYVSKVPHLKEAKSFYHSRTMAYCVPRWKSLEVDELMDFICIEAVLAHRQELNKSLV